MKRPRFLALSGALAASALQPAIARPSPSHADWERLSAQLGGRLIKIDFPLDHCKTAPNGDACKTLFENLHNPYFIGESPALTQTLGWVDAWTTSPSIYAVAARDARDVAAAVNFAREHNVRLAVKGGGHSYQGTSNAPDSLLVWTRRINQIDVQGDRVTLGSGVIWLHAYDAVTTQHGKYVQGGGCATVGVAGLISSGGFGSFSKRYGSAAGSLLEAEVVTADGRIRTVDSQHDADLFWALKGGGGGTFGVITKLTLQLHDLPAFFGGVVGTIEASSDEAYRALIRRFVAFYEKRLFNEHWGEQAGFGPDNTLSLSMVFQGMDAKAATAIWSEFFDWVNGSPREYKFASKPFVGAAPARQWWNASYMNAHLPGVFKIDTRPGAKPGNAWWAGDSGQVGQYLYSYESLWLPGALLQANAQSELAGALFGASRFASVNLHFNKGLAGAPPEAIERARQTATNPSMADAFALAISASGQGPAYPGIARHEPDVAQARERRAAVRACMNALRALAPGGGSYVSESDYFEPDWQHSYWGRNYARLSEIKRRYDPHDLFRVHNGVTAAT